MGVGDDQVRRERTPAECQEINCGALDGYLFDLEAGVDFLNTR